MVKRLLISIVLITSFLGFNANQASASHIPGANITWTCDPANPLEYTFTLTIFRKCPGTHPVTMAASYFSMTNTCGLVNPVVPIFNQVGIAEDVNQLCATATSNCSGGTDPGVWLYTYEATITLPADCDAWTIGFDLCCRDASTNMTGTSSNNMATNSTLNTATAPCNNSPVVTAQPIPYACTNTNFNYCLTIADPEGDSTYFQMVAPPGALQAPIVHLPGYSIAAPLTGFVLDPLTGCFSFNEPLVGNYVVAIQINSYDAAGNLVASIIHDFQVMVISCTNTPPTNPAGGITNFTGTGTQVGPNTVSACFGDLVCFDVVFADPVDVGNNLTITQDGTTLLPGATFTQTGTNPVTGTFCWTSQPGYTGSVVTFIAEDDGCPVMGTTGFAVNFNITTGVYAGPNQTICGAQGASLQGFGAGTYTWTPATGLSCTNCPNPTATPGSTTTYTVTGNLTGVCSNTDQVTVNVVPDFSLNITPLNSTICANGIVQLTANGQAGFGPFTYNWTPSATLSNDAIMNPLANPITSTTYTVIVTAANGCTKQTTANITISGIGPTVTVIPADTTICPGEPVQLATTAFVYPLACGVSSGCVGTTSIFDVGAGTAANTIYGGFYGSTTVGTDYTTKVQYIFTAAELNAMGYYGGTITAFSLYFTLTNAYTYDNVNVWMGCTTQDEYLTTSFIPTGSLTQVAGPINNFNPVDNNWQNVNITDWDWDGVSNLVIQICSQEDNGGAAGSNSVRYTSTTPAYRMVYDYSSTVISCNEAIGSRVTNRPNVRFTMCTETVSSPTYSWTPAATLSNTTISNPVATPSSNTSYVVNVTNAGCTGSGIAQVNIDNSNSVVASNDFLYCLGDPAINLTAQFMINGVPAAAGAGSNCYNQHINITNPALLVGTNNFNFAATPGALTGGTLTVNAYGDLDGVSTGTNAELWTIQDETATTIGTVGGSATQCGTVHTVVIPLTAIQVSAWTANGSIDFSVVDVAGNISTTLCGAGIDSVGMTLQLDCPNGSGYTWTPTTGLSNPSIQNPTVTPTGAITYVVTATGGTCDAYDTVNVVMCVVLPIELLSFNGKNNGSVNDLFWNTASEINNDFFTLERSSDGIYFVEIGLIDGAGNSTSNINYLFTDNNPYSGINYYRLKQTDFDSEHSYSNVIAIEVQKENQLTIYPNPTTDLVTISYFENSLLNSTIKIYDTQGKLVLENTIKEDNLNYEIDIRQLNNGLYFIMVNSGNNSYKGSFLKE